METKLIETIDVLHYFFDGIFEEKMIEIACFLLEENKRVIETDTSGMYEIMTSVWLANTNNLKKERELGKKFGQKDVFIEFCRNALKTPYRIEIKKIKKEKVEKMKAISFFLQNFKKDEQTKIIIIQNSENPQRN